LKFIERFGKIVPVWQSFFSSAFSSAALPLVRCKSSSFPGESTAGNKVNRAYMVISACRRQGWEYRDTSIDIGSIADTFLVSVTVSAILFWPNIDCGIGDTFRVKIRRDSIPILQIQTYSPQQHNYQKLYLTSERQHAKATAMIDEANVQESLMQLPNNVTYYQN